MLFLLYFCAQKTSQSESPHRDCSSRIQRHTMAKTKVGKKQGAELCTVNIFFKNNTRTKMFLLNQILFFSEIQQNKFYKIRAKYLNIIRWAEYFHLQEYLVCFRQKKRKRKSKIHAFKLPIKYSIY